MMVGTDCLIYKQKDNYRKDKLIMNIKDLCYELYKLDWERNHINPQIKSDSLKNFYEESINTYYYSSYEEYLFDTGYNGEIYACYDEFIDNEYKDEEYIYSLLDNEKLFKKYLESLNNPETVYADTVDIRGLLKACEDYPKAKLFALINNKKVPVDWTGFVENDTMFLEANDNLAPITGKNASHNIKLEAEDNCWYSIFGSLFLNCEYCIVNTHGNEDFEIKNAGDNDFYEVTVLKIIDNEIILVCKNIY